MLLLVALLLGCSQAPAAADPRASALVTLDGEHAWSFAGDRAQWLAESEAIRRQVLVTSGLWPLPERGPVRSIVRGEVERGEYTVQRVLLETWPGFFLGGNLYVPAKRAEKAPAVLSPHGHWANGRFCRRGDDEVASELASGAETLPEAARFHLQARCVQLARMGCFVFAYDMVGYGDTLQLGHGQGFLDLPSLAWGESAFALQTWNSLRALDWLAALPGVDPARIGVTGASGGGTQTFVLCAIDPRPAVAFPAVMVSTGMQGGCVCETAPHLRVGLNNVAIAALMAPRPLALSGANDWTREIESRGLPELRSVYALFDARDDVAARCWPEYGHNFNLHAREEMERWFDRHLRLEAGAAARERSFTPIEPDELSALAHGGLPPEARAPEQVLASRREAAAARFRTLVPDSAAGLDAYRAVVGPALRVLTHTSLESLEPVAADRSAARTAGRSEVLLTAGDGRPAVPATLLVPERPGGTVCVAVSGLGRAALLDPATAQGSLVEAGLAKGVTWLLPRLLLGDGPAAGAAPPALRVDGDRHASYPGYTWCYNRVLIAERARDLLVAIAAARELAGERRVVLWGEGRAGPSALLAAAHAGGALEAVLVDAGLELDTIRSADDPDFLPGALRYGGLDGFAGLIAPVALDLAGREQPGTATSACYRAAGASLRSSPAPSTALAGEWLERWK